MLRAELLQDCGRSLNPAIDLGQIEGAFVQGMGWLTSEELWWDAKGRLRTHGPSTYKIPGSRDVPPVFNARILADAPNREATVFRSKAVGEPPLMLAISVWLAIRDAIASLGGPARRAPLDAPATPERVLAAVDAVRERSPDDANGPAQAPPDDRLRVIREFHGTEKRPGSRCAPSGLLLPAQIGHRERHDLGGGLEIGEPQILVGVVGVGFKERARARAIEHDRNAARRVVPRVGVERHAGHRHIDAEHSRHGA